MERMQDKAFLLRNTLSGATHNLVILFCEKAGKLAFLAPHAKQSRKRFGGALDIGLLIDFQAQSKDGGSKWMLREASVARAFPGIRVDLERIAATAGIVELIDRFLRAGDPNPRLFIDLEEAFVGLDQNREVREVVLGFQLALLAHTGFPLDSGACPVCRKIYDQSDSIGVLCKADGVIRCWRCTEKARSHGETVPEEVLRLLSELDPILSRNEESLFPIQAPQDVWAKTEELMSKVIGVHLDRPLRSSSVRQHLTPRGEST